MRRRKWPREAILAELRAIQRRGKIRITTNELVAHGYAGMLDAARRLIGPFSRVRRLAGIPDPGRASPVRIERWDEDRVIGEIRARRREGKSLATTSAPTRLVSAGAPTGAAGGTRSRPQASTTTTFA